MVESKFPDPEDSYGVKGLGFCKQACRKTGAFIEKVFNVLQLHYRSIGSR